MRLLFLHHKPEACVPWERQVCKNPRLGLPPGSNRKQGTEKQVDRDFTA
jgi:hypothetical protein